jgi:hypothetical protein
MSASGPVTSVTPDSHVADAIARAELRRAQLERLVVIGMELAEEIREPNVQSPLRPEPRREPCRAFATLSRAVRLTLAFAARIDVDILAMRNGQLPSRPTARAPAAPDAPVFGAAPTESADPRRLKVRGAVWGAINHEIGDPHEATYALDCLHESLIEREDYEDLLDGSWRECVAAVCADLGLHPDWSRWSDETGFPMHDEGPHKDWPRFWSYDPVHAEDRRRRRAERLEAAETMTAARRLE